MAATIANRCDDQGFMKELTDLATKTAADPDPLKTITRLAASGGTGIDTTTATGGFLSSLFGHNLSSMVDSISNYAGLRGSSAASILSVAAPLVLGYFGRMMRSDNLTTAGLADRLRGHRNQLASAVPLGFEMPEFFHSPYRAARTAVDESVKRVHAREADSSWSVPVLALLGLLGLGGLIWWASHKPVVEQSRVEVTEPMAPATVPLPAAPVAPAIGTTGMNNPAVVGTTGTIPGKMTRTLPGNVIITVPSGSAEDRLYNYLSSSGTGGTVIDFDRIKFGTGSAVLSSQARDQIDTIAVILKAYPTTMVTVRGFTDNAGNEHANMALSKTRAEAVAGRLAAKGIGSDRVHAEGLGSQTPVGDNKTENGRAENRRVVLNVR